MLRLKFSLGDEMKTSLGKAIWLNEGYLMMLEYDELRVLIIDCGPDLYGHVVDKDPESFLKKFFINRMVVVKKSKLKDIRGLMQ